MGRDLLAGRTALVTGGSGGIGRALALQLAAEGTAVALGFRTSRESAEQLAAEIAEQGRPVVAIEADLSKPEVPVELAEAVEFALGPIDILVANAGVGRVASYEEVDGALFDETLTVNAIAPALIEDTGIALGDPQQLAARIPVGRLGTPAEVADLTVAVPSERLHHQPGLQHRRRRLPALSANRADSDSKLSPPPPPRIGRSRPALVSLLR